MINKLKKCNQWLESKLKPCANRVVWGSIVLTVVFSLVSMRIFGFIHWLPFAWVTGALCAISLRSILKAKEDSRYKFKCIDWINVSFVILSNIVLMVSLYFGPEIPFSLSVVAIVLTVLSIIICLVTLGVPFKKYRTTDKFVFVLSGYTLVISIYTTF
ncbi:TPA: hypothetical protein NJY97_004607 [Vibrio parahaemolyticus]|nr:hypothetical protein [Vibrio parahaemolyticus]MDG2677783.1 hypothetical protein [Vibrio parahaemolyticus]HCE1609412.1 hypothetical protein [Vibrio parahaemolyticus]HCE5232376.1 hypothetical protein [Vibrio parahaemolyticus]HCG5110858.1 hypothetical protein [Vibrio parahaemolyticus]